MSFEPLERVLQALEDAIKHAGSASAYAQKLGVSPAFVSAVRNSNKLPSGVILADLGYEHVNAYRYIGAKPSPEQERYENSRRQWREENLNITKDEIVAQERSNQG